MYRAPLFVLFFKVLLEFGCVFSIPHWFHKNVSFNYLKSPKNIVLLLNDALKLKCFWEANTSKERIKVFSCRWVKVGSASHTDQTYYSPNCVVAR